MKRPNPKHLRQYHNRDLYLKELGYLSYKDYLNSDDWKKIRSRVLGEHRVCIMCERPSQVVHHVKYHISVLLGLDDHCLAPLCHRCHESIELKNGVKVSLGTANSNLFRQARKCKAGLAWADRYYKGHTAIAASGRKKKQDKIQGDLVRRSRNWQKPKQ